MTRSELRELTRFYVDELGTSRIKDSDVDEYDLNQALFAALQRYFRKTCCSLVQYTLPATEGQAVYGYEAFGVHAADADGVSVDASASTTTAFVLLTPVEPADYISVTFKNTTGAAAVGTATVVAVVGTAEDGSALTENLTFTAAELTLEDGESYTETTTAKFATITSITPTAGQAAATWLHSAGIDTNPAKYSALAAANNTDAFTLIANFDPSRYVTVTINNPTAGIVAELARSYTIVGTRHGGIAYTEVLTATAQNLAATTGTEALRSLQPFASVLSITPSAAQTAGLRHTAGFEAESAGERIFHLTYLAYDEQPLTIRSRDYMNKFYAKWRFTGNGTPSTWIQEADKLFRLWYPPDGALDIYIEGYQTPDSRCFDNDAQEPPIEATEQEILAMDAAILVCQRDSRDEQLLRGTQLWRQREEAWAKAHRRIHGTGDPSIIFGRGNPPYASDMPPYSNGVTNIS